MPAMNVRMTLLMGALSCVAAAGCSRPSAEVPAARRHEHHPPHGGTAVVLGSEQYHLECVLDAASGRLQAWVLDGEMDGFVRVAARSIELQVRLRGTPHELVLDAVADPLTGETVGDTSAFAGQADWLRGASGFDATLRAITVKGTPFADVAFNFPKGNDPD